MRHAEFALYRRDPRATVELAALVRDEVAAPLQVRRLATHREAQAHALIGNASACDRALRQAIDLDIENIDSTEHFGSSVGALDLAITGWCYHELGRFDQATELLETVTTSIPAWARRARGRHSVRLARALVASGRLDRAEAIVDSALEDVRHTRSATAYDEMRLLSSELLRRHHHPTSRNLRLSLTAALHGATAITSTRS